MSSPSLKQATYQGFEKSRGPIRFVYLVAGNNVYYSGVDLGTSTINAAERIITAISDAEGINWEDYTFHDIQTRRTYDTGHEFDPNYYCVDRLTIDNLDGRPYVSGWQTIALSEAHARRSGINPDSLPRVPADVLDAFRELIFEKKEETE